MHSSTTRPPIAQKPSQVSFQKVSLLTEARVMKVHFPQTVNKRIILVFCGTIDRCTPITNSTLREAANGREAQQKSI